MKIVMAPNAFKGSLTAVEAAQAMKRGALKVLPEADIVTVPVADGGDGLAEVMLAALGGESRMVSVQGPRGRGVEASFCYVPQLKLAAIEMALASGLALLPESERDPSQTTTYGTGELIAAALDLDVEHIIVGIGGSATNDGGIGMAAALGIRFLDDDGQVVDPVGGNLGNIRRIDRGGLDPRTANASFEVICDVDNPLHGPDGAAYVYGPQKGATAEQVQQLDAGLANLAQVIEHDLGMDVRHLPGAGAAGGLGAGLKAFLHAELRRGVDVVLEVVELSEKLRGADLVFTAEGQIDFQTAYGKAPAGVAQKARARGIPCIALAGSVGERIDELHKVGINAVFSLCPGPISLEKAMDQGADLLVEATQQALRCFLAGKDMVTI
jgi:glycerate kinase